MEQMRCRLPGGYVDRGGTLHRDAEIAPLCGRDEELLSGARKQASAPLVTEILSRCVRRIGSIAPVPPEVARELLVGDRQYLLLKLREATFGPRVLATIACPWPDCGKSVDIDFRTGDIPVREAEARQPRHTIELSAGSIYAGPDGRPRREISFRLPNGDDQERLSPSLLENEAEALALLLGRCIEPDADGRSGGEIVAVLSPAARLEIELAMRRLAPAVELTMETDCPECRREFTVPFDLQDFFFGELRISRDLLYREVHYLAYHYHWSEREIMELPRGKRRSYIEILADEIEKYNDALY